MSLGIVKNAMFIMAITLPKQPFYPIAFYRTFKMSLRRYNRYLKFGLVIALNGEIIHP